MLDELLYLLGIYDNNIVDSTQKFAYESSDSESCFLFNLFVEYKLLVLGIMFLFLLFTNWLVRLNKTNLEGKKNADIAHCSKASVCSITHLTNDDAKKIYSCIKVQDKVFKKLIFNEMKLKFLENLMFSFWNKTHQKSDYKRQPTASPASLGKGRPDSRIKPNYSEWQCTYCHRVYPYPVPSSKPQSCFSQI